MFLSMLTDIFPFALLGKLIACEMEKSGRVHKDASWENY